MQKKTSWLEAMIENIAKSHFNSSNKRRMWSSQFQAHDPKQSYQIYSGLYAIPYI